MNQEAAKTTAEIGRLVEMLHPDNQAAILQIVNACLLQQTALEGGSQKQRGACKNERSDQGSESGFSERRDRSGKVRG